MGLRAKSVPAVPVATHAVPLVPSSVGVPPVQVSKFPLVSRFPVVLAFWSADTAVSVWFASEPAGQS
ncbi:unnamed protein product [Gemmata obscuriglobus UQM 2246]|nr:unnamed protein product [Gemmata obscuriglobus UQM 2246]